MKYFFALVFLLGLVVSPLGAMTPDEARAVFVEHECFVSTSEENKICYQCDCLDDIDREVFLHYGKFKDSLEEPPSAVLVEMFAADFASNSGWKFEDQGMATDDLGALFAEGEGGNLRYDLSGNTGDLYLWVLGQGPSGNSDSIYFGLDGVVLGAMDWWNFSSNQQGGWVSVTRQGAPAKLNLTGDNTLDIWAREDGFRIEKILLTNDADFRPGA